MADRALTVPQRAEVLAADGLRLTVARHPFGAGAAVTDIAAGDTVAEIVGLHWPHAMRCAATADGVPVVHADWDRVRPRGTIELVGVPRGPLAAAVAAIASAVSSAVGAITGGALFSGFTGKLLGAALSIGARFLLNALFPPPQPQLAEDDTPSPTYSIGGARNELRPFEPVAVVLGTHRVSPAYAAVPYTEFVGDDQYLRAIFCWGHGPLTISDIRIGETAITEFEDVEIETFEGLSGDSAPTLYPGTVIQEDLNITLEASTGQVRTTADNIDEIIVDVVAPNGLFRITKADGQRVQFSVVFTIEYAVAGSGSWTLAATVTLGGDKPDAIRRGYRFAVTRGRYDVRLTRTTAAYSGTDDGQGNIIQETVSEDIVWTAVRGVRNESPVNTDVPVALTAIRIRATEQLSGNIETLNGMVSSRVTAWNGSAWVADTVSTNPADLIRHVLQSEGNRRPLADSLIDLAALQDFHAWCVTKGFTFNHVRDFSASVWETVRDIAAAGRAIVTFLDGKWSVRWDDSADAVVQHFTPANSSAFSGQRDYIDLPHAFRVRFINANRDYLQDERVVYDDGYDANNATRFEGLEFPGVTDPDLIWKLARYHLAQLKLRRETYELTTDFEHLVCTRGDRVRVTHDVPKWGLGYGRVKAVSGDQITIDGDVTMEAAGSYAIRFRRSDGTSSLRTVVTEAGTVSIINLVADAGEASPAVDDLFMFGVLGLESVVLRLQSIRPIANLGARLTLVDDAPAIHDADTGTIPTFTTGISEPVNLFVQRPRNVRAVETLYLEDGGLFAGANVSWEAPTLGVPNGYSVQFKSDQETVWTNAGTVAASSRKMVVQSLSSGTYRFRVKALYGNEASDWSAEAVVIVIGPEAVPDDVPTFRASAVGDSIVLTWTRQPGVLVRDHEIRFVPVTSGAAWSAGVPLVTGVEGATFTGAYAKGTYMIKARSWRNVYSANATLIVMQSEPIRAINAVETATDDPDLTEGTFTDTYYDPVNGGVILDNAADFFSGRQFFTGGQFFSGGREAVGFYQLLDSVDLGAVYTSRLSASITAGGLNMISAFFTNGQFFTDGQFFSTDIDQWEVRPQVRFTDDDPAGSPTWSDWEDLLIGDKTGRGFQFRVRLLSRAANITPLLTAASFTVDMPDRVIAAEDVQSTASGITLSFSPSFRALKALLVTGQDMQQGDYHVITAKSVSGATVTFYDSNDAKIDRSFDYQAIGYGSVGT